MTPSAWHALRPFERPDAAVGVHAVAERRDGRIALSYRIDGAAAVRWPEPVRPPARAERLWERTCVEAFLAPAGGAAYWEVNLSPSGAWQVYRFEGRRGGMRVEADAAVHFEVTRVDGTCRIAASLALPAPARGALAVGLSAVIEHPDGRRTYWALQHGGAQPDFHDPAAFTVRLAAEAT